MSDFIKSIFGRFSRFRNEAIIFFTALFTVNCFMFGHIFSELKEMDLLRIYFFDVGQGDAELVVFPGGAKILIDGGPPNGKVLRGITKALSPFSRRIDLVANTHPQLDHYGGLRGVAERYKIGAFLSSGVSAPAPGFSALFSELENNGVEKVVLRSGDRIRYGESVIEVLSPTSEIVAAAKDLNDVSLVLALKSKNTSVIFTGDIGGRTEELAGEKVNFPSDILKVAHHGSKYSSAASFLKSVNPKIAVIEVGKNSYGHPTKEALARLRAAGALVFRTDRDGTVKITSDGGKLRIKKNF